jgi:hypothetical protein
MSGNASARRPSFGVAQDRLPEATREMQSPSNYATTFATSEASCDGGVFCGVYVFCDLCLVS